MDLIDTNNRLSEANRLLFEDTTSTQKLESLSAILKGLNPKLDKALRSCAESFSKIEKLQNGDVISLTADSLPENSEEEKKRKKAIIALIRTWEDLKSEVERVKSEFENSKNPTQQAQSTGRMIAFAKGPFGIVTIAAVLIVGFLTFTNLNKAPQTQSISDQSPVQTITSAPQNKIKVIIFNGKKIPITELNSSIGSECAKVSHYHAVNHTSVKALDGSIVADPGDCGFGKVSDVKVVESE